MTTKKIELKVVDTKTFSNVRLQGATLVEYSSWYPYSIVSGSTHLYAAKTLEEAEELLERVKLGHFGTMEDVFAEERRA